VHGAYTAQRALEAGVLDELMIHQAPGAPRPRGRRLFGELPSGVELEIVRVIDTPRPRTCTIAYAAEPVDQPVSWLWLVGAR